MIVRIVTGASGFIGLALTQHLAGLPEDLHAFDATGSPVPGVDVGRVDCRSDEFDEHVRHALNGATRGELYEATGTAPHLKRISNTRADEFTNLLTADLAPSYAAARTFAEVAESLGVPGSVTLLSSVGATRAHRFKVAYDAAKAGMESIARTFALEYGPTGISARAVEIGPISDSPTTMEDGDRLQALTELVPTGRYPSLTEVVSAVAAFGSPAFDIANGAVLPLDGGLIQQLRPASVERPPDA